MRYLVDIGQLNAVQTHYQELQSNGNLIEVIQPSRGGTPINSACKKGHVDIAQWLVASAKEDGFYEQPGSKPTDHTGSTRAFHEFQTACEYAQLPIAQWILQEINSQLLDVQRKFQLEDLWHCKKVRGLDFKKTWDLMKTIFIDEYLDWYLLKQFNTKAKEAGLLNSLNEPESHIAPAKLSLFKKNHLLINSGLIHATCRSGHIELVRWLITKKNLTEISQRDGTPEYFLSFSTAMKKSELPLHEATEHNHGPIAMLLIMKGALKNTIPNHPHQGNASARANKRIDQDQPTSAHPHTQGINIER